MEKPLLRCYAIVTTLAILFLICYTGHEHGEVADQFDLPAIVSDEPLQSKSTSPIAEGLYEVVRVVDGDHHC